jgi:hypothetical protein
LTASGKQFAWLVKPESKRKPADKRRKPWRTFKSRRLWQRIRKRAYLVAWRRRMTAESRCHECGGPSDFNSKRGKSFNYCPSCRQVKREWQKLVMRRRRARGLAK